MTKQTGRQADMGRAGGRTPCFLLACVSRLCGTLLPHAVSCSPMLGHCMVINLLLPALFLISLTFPHTLYRACPSGSSPPLLLTSLSFSLAALPASLSTFKTADATQTGVTGLNSDILRAFRSLGVSLHLDYWLAVPHYANGLRRRCMPSSCLFSSPPFSMAWYVA